VLVTTFLAGRGIGVQDVSVISGADEQVSPEIVDSELAEAFRLYHTKLAVLDLVTQSVNLAQSGRLRMRPSRIRLTE
jgi:hypothetical protein